jgi:hypothetical protein
MNALTVITAPTTALPTTILADLDADARQSLESPREWWTIICKPFARIKNVGLSSREESARPPSSMGIWHDDLMMAILDREYAGIQRGAA